MSFVQVHTTFPDEEGARSFARSIVDEKMAACAQILPIESFYRWKGAVESGKEYLLIMKTSEDRIEGIRMKLKSTHPYEVPEFWILPVSGGSDEYLDWISNSIW